MDLIRTRVNLYRVGALVFGTLLWLQVSASALSEELSYLETNWWKVSLATIPLLLLPVSLIIPSPLLSLFLFPVGVALSLGTGSPGMDGGWFDTRSTLLSLTTLLAYVGSAGAWLASPSVPSYLLVSTRPVKLKRDQWLAYRGVFLPRVVLMILAFAVTAAAVVLSKGISHQVARFYGDVQDPMSVERGLVLCNLLMFFVWCVLGFTLFIAPLSDLKRQSSEEWQASRSSVGSSRRAGIRLRAGVLSLVAGGLVALWWLWRG